MTTQYNWNFGDQTTASGITVFKSYNNSGNYNVLLNQQNEWGSSTTGGFVNVISALENGDVVPGFNHSAIYGTLIPGEYEVGIYPIAACNYQYSSYDAITVNRFYFEKDDSNALHGGTVFCSANSLAPYIPRSFEEDLIDSIPTCQQPVTYCCRGFTLTTNPQGHVGITYTPCLTDSGSPIVTAEQCAAYVQANNTTLIIGYTVSSQFETIGGGGGSRAYYMVSIEDKYKGILRSPVLNKSGIVELVLPRINLTGNGFEYLTGSLIPADQLQTYTNFFNSLIGKTMTIKQVDFSDCPEYKPVGRTLAIYKMTGYQKNLDGRMNKLITFKYSNGDLLLSKGKYVCPSSSIYIQPTDSQDTPENYSLYGEQVGQAVGNLYEYANQFLYNNKQNGMHAGRFVRILERQDPVNGFAKGWHERDIPRGLANKLHYLDGITVTNPENNQDSEFYTIETHLVTDSVGGWKAPVTPGQRTFTNKFISMDLTNGTKYVRDRALQFFNSLERKFSERNIKLNAFYTNITTEMENNAPDLTSYVLGTLPFCNDNVVWNGHGPSNGVTHFSINPWQESEAPYGPQPGFTATIVTIETAGVDNSYYYYNYVKSGAWVINPKNQYLKNWLKAHANGNEAQKQSVYDLFTYSYAENVDESNIFEYIDKDFGIFTGDGVNSYMPVNNVYKTGYTSFGIIGFDEQFYYGKIALDKLSSKPYYQIQKVLSGTEGITGFPECNFLNYLSRVCSIKGRTAGFGGTFEYDDSIYINFVNRPGIEALSYSDIDTIIWYGYAPNTSESYVMTGSYVQKALSEKFRIKNYIKYPHPRRNLTLKGGFTDNNGKGTYDDLAQKTFPFWVIVHGYNNMVSMWRNQPDRKKSVFLSVSSDSQSEFTFYPVRLEYNIHGILATSNDILIPYFEANGGPGSITDLSMLNAFRDVNKIIQNNRKRFVYTKDPYSFNYMSPTYLNMSLDGKTYTNLLNIPPLCSCVEFGGVDDSSVYPYLACRVTVPYPANFFSGLYAAFPQTKVDYGSTLGAGEAYPNYPPPLRVGVSFGDGSEAIYNPGFTASCGLWIVGENNNKFKNMNFRLILGACGSTGACCSGTGPNCFGITSIDNCSKLNGYFFRGKTCSACTGMDGIVPLWEVEGDT